jgi:hypothetical protein
MSSRRTVREIVISCTSPESSGGHLLSDRDDVVTGQSQINHYRKITILICDKAHGSDTTRQRSVRLLHAQANPRRIVALHEHLTSVSRPKHFLCAVDRIVKLGEKPPYLWSDARKRWLVETRKRTKRTSRLTARSPQERRHRHTDDQAKCCKQRKSGTCKPGFDLKASSRAVQTPFAEVLTVIGQQPIAVFPHTGSCSADDLSNVEIGWRIRSHPDAPSAREMSERNFFHRSSAQAVREPRVVNDLASTDVDAVMQIAAPRRDNVRTQRGFSVPDQEPVASELPAR